LKWENQNHLGFKTKITFHEDPIYATFLKGWWTPDIENHYRWLPLPSQLIKLGKVITNPVNVFPKDSILDAHAKMAKGIALSFSCVPDNYPLLGPFLKKYRELTHIKVNAIDRHFHKIKMTGPQISVDIACMFHKILKRYNLTTDELFEMQHELDRAPFPCVMTHDGWVKIARCDYG